MTRRKKKPTAQPRALQTRPTISFRTDRPILEAMDDYARRLECTRNDLLEAVFKLYLSDRGEDIETMVRSKLGGQHDDQQLNIFA